MTVQQMKREARRRAFPLPWSPPLPDPCLMALCRPGIVAERIDPLLETIETAFLATGLEAALLSVRGLRHHMRALMTADAVGRRLPGASGPWRGVFG